MSDYFFSAFYTGGIVLCALMAVVWLFRIKSKGATAWLMAAAFLALGALFFAFRDQWPLGLQIGIGALVLVLLVADGVVRAGRYPHRND
jgi:hypothetical protein